MQTKIIEIAQRIKGLRELMNIEAQDMADFTGVDINTYYKYEDGKVDFGSLCRFSFCLKL